MKVSYRIGFAPCVLVFALVSGGCGPSKEELRLTSELSTTQQNLATAERNLAVAKEDAEAAKALDDKLSVGLMRIENDAKTSAGELTDLRLKLAQRDSELLATRTELEAVKQEAEKMRTAKNDAMHKMLSALRKLDANIDQQTPSAELKPMIADTQAQLSDFVENGEIAKGEFADAAQKTIDAISDLVTLEETHEWLKKRSSIFELYFFEGQLGWDLVTKWNYPKDRIRPFNEAMPGYTPALTTNCASCDLLRLWIEDIETANLKKLIKLAAESRKNL